MEAVGIKEDKMRKGQKFRIRKRTYRNFVWVMKQIMAKGYDQDEAWKTTNHFFNQLEDYPNGISIEKMVEQVLPYDEWIKEVRN